jgi:hypothetical protein
MLPTSDLAVEWLIKIQREGPQTISDENVRGEFSHFKLADEVGPGTFDINETGMKELENHKDLSDPKWIARSSN